MNESMGASPTSKFDEEHHTYRYLPIDAENEIRVLRLEPSAFSDPLVATLLPRQMKIDPENLDVDYACVSYCWGKNENFRWLSCDGQRFRITAVVDTMLRYLRKPVRSRNLWIDAICINQNDENEKAKQVASMGRIYHTANKVHVWLGPETGTDGVSSVFAYLKQCVLNPEEFPGTAGIPTNMAFRLSTFFSKPWFTRRWVLQEVALAHAVSVHCGFQQLSWNWFQPGVAKLWDFAKRPMSHGVLSPEATQALENIFTLQDLRMEKVILQKKTRDVEVSEPYVWMETLLRFLWTYHTTLCFDERDRFFALFGILKNKIGANLPLSYDADLLHPRVDYTAHFAHIYTEFAVAAVSRGMGLAILHHVIAFGSLAQQDPAWPSWVPSWNQPRTSRYKLKILFDPRHTAPLRRPHPLNDVDFKRSQGYVYDDPEGYEYIDETSPLVKLVEVYGQDAIQFSGAIFPIISTQSLEECNDVIQYFRRWIQETRGYRLSTMAATLISETIEHTAGLYTRKDIAIGDITHSAPSFSDPQRRLRHILECEFDGSMERHVGYDSQILAAEVNRVLRGFMPFVFQDVRGSDTFPGIAFTEVRPGDCVFWVSKGKPAHCNLVVRRYNTSSQSPANVFRLVGASIDHSVTEVSDHACPDRRYIPPWGTPMDVIIV